MLAARNISVSISGKIILDDAGFTLAAGELVGLIGPNGAGKSTLLQSVLGLSRRDRGTVTIDGSDFSRLPAKERARRIAFLPQERHVEWLLKAQDLVMLGRYPHQSGFGGYSLADRAAVDRAVDAIDGAPLMQKTIKMLSGGERTLVLLARALAVEAPFLLADEPIAGLDPYHQLHVLEVLKERARQGAGVLAVMHDLTLAARFMDRVVVMHEGSVFAEGKPEAVLTPQTLSRVYRIDGINGARI